MFVFTILAHEVHDLQGKLPKMIGFDLFVQESASTMLSLCPSLEFWRHSCSGQSVQLCSVNATCTGLTGRAVTEASADTLCGSPSH